MIGGRRGRLINRIRTAVQAAGGAVAGAAYGLATAHGASVTGLARGALSGALIAAIITSLDAFALKAPGAPLTRTPFLLNVGVRSLVYLVVFLLVIPAGNWLLPNPDAEGTINISRDDIVFSFAVLFVVTFLLEVNTLLGQNVLLAFITGRYHRPRVEQRVFLIIDMKNSTAAAERLGEVAFHGLLNRLIGDLSGAIVAHKGEIHKYVGDELIATWPLAEGLKPARCLLFFPPPSYGSAFWPLCGQKRPGAPEGRRGRATVEASISLRS